MKLETLGKKADMGIVKTAVVTGRGLGWVARKLQQLSDKMTITTVIEIPIKK